MIGAITWNGQFSIGDVVTAASILVAAITFVFRSWQSEQTERRRNTFQLLSRIFEPGPVADARMVMARWISTGREIEGDLLDAEDDDLVILAIVDYYEFVCEGAIRGVVDWRLVNQESGGRMERTYMVVRKYIQKRQLLLSELNRERGLEPVILYKHLRLFLSKYRSVDTSL